MRVVKIGKTMTVNKSYSVPRNRSRKYHKSLERSVKDLNSQLVSSTEDWLSGKISDSKHKKLKEENNKQLSSLLSGHYKKI